VFVENEVRLSIQLNQKILEGQEIIIEGVQKHSNREVSSKIEVVELKEIEKRGIRDISEILNEIDGVNINTTSFGKQSISIRGSNPNEIAVYIDGIKLNNSATGAADLAYIDLADLDEIEVRLPEGVEARDVGVVAQFLDSASNPVGEPVVVQEPADAPAEKPEPPVEISTEKLEPPAQEPTEKPEPLVEKPAREPSAEESTEEPPAEEPKAGRGRRQGTRSKQ
jgi:hypothetical protein